MTTEQRVTVDPLVMWGIPCIRGMNVTVSSIVGLVEEGATPEQIVQDYPYLEIDDIRAAVDYEASQTGLAGRPFRKPRPNHQRRLQILRAMSPQEKLAQVFNLNARTLKLFRVGLRRRFPDLSEADFEKLYLQMRARWHNRTY